MPVLKFSSLCGYSGALSACAIASCCCSINSHPFSSSYSPVLLLLILVPCRPGNRGITACCFSPDGTKLVCICTDNQHTMYIWDWKRKRVRGD